MIALIAGTDIVLPSAQNAPPSTASGSKRAAYASARLIREPKRPCDAKRSATVSPGGGLKHR